MDKKFLMDEFKNQELNKGDELILNQNAMMQQFNDQISMLYLSGL